MAKKPTKAKSKKMSLKQKHKVRRKVKEHHEKKVKENKKKAVHNHPKRSQRGEEGVPGGEKDPIQEAKEEQVREFAFQRAKMLADEKYKKEQRKANNGRRTADPAEEAAAVSAFDLAKLQASASGKQADFETRKRARLTEDFQSDKDNSKKAFYREFKKVVQLADVVIQVLDARDPLACRCPDVEKYIRQTNPNKRIVLLLNKMDLVPREVGEKWLKYFREELPTVAFKCSTQQQSDRLGRRKMPSSAGKPGSSSSSTQCGQVEPDQLPEAC